MRLWQHGKLRVSKSFWLSHGHGSIADFYDLSLVVWNPGEGI
jgi:hypothetical protein